MELVKFRELMKISLVITMVRDYRSKEDDDDVKEERKKEKSEVVDQLPRHFSSSSRQLCVIVYPLFHHDHDHLWADDSQQFSYFKLTE